MGLNRFPRPCLTCGTPTKQGSYCPQHTRPKAETPHRKAKKRERYNADYQRRAKHVRDNATQCWICGGGPRPHDPWQADHLLPGDPGSPLAAAHRTCNARRGDKTIEQVRQAQGAETPGRGQSR